MSGQHPVGVGSPTGDDVDALAVLDANDAERLRIVRSRAEKWLGGLTALTGLLATVLIVKGPDTVTDLSVGWRAGVAASIAAALAGLAYATWCAYASAFGDPTTLDSIDRSPVTGLAGRLAQARRAAATRAQQQMVHALVATFVGIALLVAAVALTWFAPTTAEAGTGSTCLLSGQEVLAQLPGPAVTVEATGPGVTVGTCP